MSTFATIRERLQRGTGESTLLMLVLLIVVGAVFAILNPVFLTPQNLSNLATQVAPTLVGAVAMTFILTTAEIDLSTGSVLAFVAVSTAWLLKQGVTPALVILVALGLGSLCGFLNGWFTAYQKMPSFVVTLATMSIVRGAALMITMGFSISIDASSPILLIGQGKFLGVSYAAWIALLAAVVGVVLLRYMRYGQYVTGIGSNQESVRRAGINTRRIKLVTFIFMGFMAGVAGLITAARLGSGDANTATDYGMSVITAVVIGGTDLFGGKGTMAGSVVGAVFVGMLANGLTILGMSPYLTPILTGAILILVIWFNMKNKDLTAVLKTLFGRREA